MTEPKHLHFADRVEFSAQDKTAISVRDGVLEYLGSELGMEPADKVFTVYRSPATIANTAAKMIGIPLTDEHIPIEGDAPDTGSAVTGAVMIDVSDELTGARLGVKNTLSVSDAMMAVLDSKRELSLGYGADLVAHDQYDFEQMNIDPHHLAAVENGRCGPLCCFLDKKPVTIEVKPMAKTEARKMFYDENGTVSLEQVVEIATSLPEAIRQVPVDRLSELMTPLLEIMSYAKEQGAMPADKAPEEEVKDEEYKDEEEKEKFEDSQKFKDAVVATARKLADTEVKRYAQVMGKAKDFLDAGYDYGSKNAGQIMRDALATQYGDQQFEDAELPTAFKLLKKSAPDYSKFGDSALPSSLEKRIESYIKE